MTTFLPRSRWRPDDEYDDRARWLDDRDGGDRWRSYAACHGSDPALFFPVKIERRVVERRNADGEVTGSEVVEVPTDEEVPYPPDDVKEICARCPVMGRCLDQHMEDEFGIFGGTTGYQRQLLTKKIVRRRCPGCGSEDLVLNSTQKKEICLACSISWDVL